MQKKIGVLPGDGIGPEVVAQGIKVLNAIGERYGHSFQYEVGEIGASAIDKTGSALPDRTLDICLASDAILLGAVGDPRFDLDPNAKVRPEQGLLALRKSLGLFANIRPITTFDALIHLSPLKEEKIKGANFIIYRELTGGLYFGKKERNGDTAFDNCTYSTLEISRIAKLAFEAAIHRDKKLTLVDKANVLETSRLWRDTVSKIQKEQYPEVELELMFVDNAAMQLIQQPNKFDVVLTENMFGDILSDEASVITGSLGLLPSASIGEKTSLFEPVHGSYPQAAGKDIANPFATILSVAMMLESFDMFDEALAVNDAVKRCLEEGFVTVDIAPQNAYHCSKVGDLIALLIMEEGNTHFNKHNIEDSESIII
ncbi:MAG: 3-isopropylmalate dehydrogenase [Bacteroidota bacterium]